MSPWAHCAVLILGPFLHSAAQPVSTSSFLPRSDEENLAQVDQVSRCNLTVFFREGEHISLLHKNEGIGWCGVTAINAALWLGEFFTFVSQRLVVQLPEKHRCDLLKHTCVSTYHITQPSASLYAKQARGIARECFYTKPHPDVFSGFCPGSCLLLIKNPPSSVDSLIKLPTIPAGLRKALASAMFRRRKKNLLLQTAFDGLSI